LLCPNMRQHFDYRAVSRGSIQGRSYKQCPRGSHLAIICGIDIVPGGYLAGGRHLMRASVIVIANSYVFTAGHPFDRGPYPVIVVIGLPGHPQGQLDPESDCNGLA